MKGQISVEYLIFTGILLGLIILPSMIFLFSFAREGVYEGVSQKQMQDLGLHLVDAAQDVYYLGLYSKQIIEVQIPSDSPTIYVGSVSNDATTAYYIIIQGEKKYFFLSDVPITATHDFSTSVTSPNEIVEECGSSDYVCDISRIDPSYTREGAREFKVETVLGLDRRARVQISPNLT